MENPCTTCGINKFCSRPKKDLLFCGAYTPTANYPKSDNEVPAPPSVPDKPKSKTQQILEYMKTGKSLTQPQAAKLFNAWRLSDIIFKLRHRGHSFDVTLKGKSGYAEYRYRDQK
jgi:hypothetical protein